MNTASFYIRVSTDEQDSTNQLPGLMEYAKARGYEVVAVYEENGSAWKAGHQPQLAELLETIRSGRRNYDVLLVWALDRLSRQGPLAILQLVHTFKIYGTKVISLQESWAEAPGEVGEVLFAIAGWVARMESQRRSERTLAGLARAKAERGKLPVRGKDKKRRVDIYTLAH